MPTGYTARIDTKDFNLKKWILEDLVRGMGVCITLRDELRDLTYEEILERLNKNIEHAYYYKELEKAKKELEIHSQKLVYEVKDEFEEHKKERKTYLKTKLKENNDLIDKYGESLKNLRDLKSKTDNDFIKKVLDFGISQIQSSLEYDDMSRYYNDELKNVDKLDFPTWLNNKEIKLKSDVEYYTRGLKEETNRETERYQLYKELVEFMNKYEVFD
jgi:hypothetical protein